MKVLIIEDNFPMESKESIEKEAGVAIDLVENYQDAMVHLNCDINDYVLVVIDINLPEKPPEPVKGSLFERICNARGTEKELMEDSLAIYRQWEGLGYELPRLQKEEIIKAHNFRRLALGAGQWGLLIASTVHQLGVPYVVFTTDVGHSLPSLELLMASGVVSAETIPELWKAQNSSEALFRDNLVIGPVPTAKENPQNWINLLCRLVD